jgi:hypothetical protein
MVWLMCCIDNFLDEYDPTIEDSYRRMALVAPADGQSPVPLKPSKASKLKKEANSSTSTSTTDNGTESKIDLTRGKAFAKPENALLDILDTAGPGWCIPFHTT